MDNFDFEELIIKLLDFYEYEREINSITICTDDIKYPGVKYKCPSSGCEGCALNSGLSIKDMCKAISYPKDIYNNRLLAYRVLINIARRIESKVENKPLLLESEREILDKLKLTDYKYSFDVIGYIDNYSNKGTISNMLEIFLNEMKKRIKND